MGDIIMLNTKDIAAAIDEAKEEINLGDPVLEEIHDAGNRDLLGISEEDFALYAHMSTVYEGELPASYRVLNAIILDMVTDNLEAFNTTLSKPTHDYIKANYGDGDLSDLEEGLEDFIWESQIDFMSSIDAENKRIYFDIELVLSMEQLEDL